MRRSCALRSPAAAIRRRIRIPLRFADDYSTTATIVSFTGLTDDQQGPGIGWGGHDEITRRLVEQRSPRLGEQGRAMEDSNADEG